MKAIEKRWLKNRNSKDELVEMIDKLKKEKIQLYKEGIDEGIEAKKKEVVDYITEKCGQEIVGDPKKGVFLKTMDLNDLITAYLKQQLDSQSDKIKLKELCDKEALLLGEVSRLQNIIASREYQLEAYRSVLKDVHDNVKINPEAHRS